MRCTTCSPTPDTPAPTRSGGPVKTTSIDLTGRCASAARRCRKPNGRCSSPIITRGSSTGTPTRTTRSGSPPTPARRPISPAPARSGKAAALLQGLATCGVCGRKLAVCYTGPAKAAPGYYCTGTGHARRGPRHSPPACRRRRDRRRGHQSVPGRAATLRAAGLPGRRPAARGRPRRRARPMAPPVEQARYQAGRAERRYRAVDPDTGWSPAAWRPSGTPRCKPSPTPKPNSPAAKNTAENPEPQENRLYSPSATPSAVCGRPRPRPTETKTAAAQPDRGGQHRRAPRPPPPPKPMVRAVKGRAITAIRADQTNPNQKTTHRQGHRRTSPPPCRPLPTQPSPTSSTARPPHRPRNVVHRR